MQNVLTLVLICLLFGCMKLKTEGVEGAGNTPSLENSKIVVPSPQINYFLIDGKSGTVNINKGDSILLSWKSTNTKSCLVLEADRNFMTNAVEEELEIGNVQGSFDYTLHCTNDIITVTSVVSVHVNSLSENTASAWMKIVESNSNIISIPYNTTVGLSWNSQGVKSCTVKAKDGGQDFLINTAINGIDVRSPSLIKNTRFTLSCIRNDSFTISAIVHVNVLPSDGPIGITIDFSSLSALNNGSEAPYGQCMAGVNIVPAVKSASDSGNFPEATTKSFDVVNGHLYRDSNCLTPVTTPDAQSPTHSKGSVSVPANMRGEYTFYFKADSNIANNSTVPASIKVDQGGFSVMKSFTIKRDSITCEGRVANNQSVSIRKYKTSSVPYGSVCESEMRTKTCNNGIFSQLTGSYAFDSCIMEAEVARQVYIVIDYPDYFKNSFIGLLTSMVPPGLCLSFYARLSTARFDKNRVTTFSVPTLMSFSSTYGEIYSDAACSNQISMINLPANTSAVQFYYRSNSSLNHISGTRLTVSNTLVKDTENFNFPVGGNTTEPNKLINDFFTEKSHINNSDRIERIHADAQFNVCTPSTFHTTAESFYNYPFSKPTEILLNVTNGAFYSDSNCTMQISKVMVDKHQFQSPIVYFKSNGSKSPIYAMLEAKQENLVFRSKILVTRDPAAPPDNLDISHSDSWRTKDCFQVNSFSTIGEAELKQEVGFAWPTELKFNNIINAKVYSDNTCENPASKITVKAKESRTFFYYKRIDLSKPVTIELQHENIKSSFTISYEIKEANKLDFILNNFKPIKVNECVYGYANPNLEGKGLGSRYYFFNPSVLTFSSITNGQFFSDYNCTKSISSVPIPAFTDNVSFYYMTGNGVSSTFTWEINGLKGIKTIPLTP